MFLVLLTIAWVSAEAVEPRARLQAAYEALGAGNAEGALKLLEGTEMLTGESPAPLLVAARCLEALGRMGEAMAKLDRAANNHPTNPHVEFERADFFVRHNLQSAARKSLLRLALMEMPMSIRLAAMHLADDLHHPQPVLDSLALAAMTESKVVAHLADYHRKAGAHDMAESLFGRAARLSATDKERDVYLSQAAGLATESGRYDRAARWLVAMKPGVARQLGHWRLSFKKGDYAQVIAQPPRSLTDADRYRLAYAHYALGEFVAARGHLKHLDATALSEAAQTLLESMP